jgi:sarcosine oxidase subunit gamma
MARTKRTQVVSAPAERRHPLEGRATRIKSVEITPAGAAHRLSLRAPSASIAALSKALRVKLPDRPKSSARSKSGSRAALWLGPDEWLIVDFEGKDPLADCGGVKAFHSAVDISHRHTAILVRGADAETTVGAGCPQDLSPSAFPAGACSRTVLAKAEVVLWRTGEQEFRVECWRSFSDYVFTFLAEAARDAAA